MTRQEYYDLLVRSASDGTFPAANDKGRCMYRTPEGRRCAAGLLIPDDKYDEGMETKAVHHLMSIYPAAVTLPDGMNVADLSECQGTHDGETANPGGWNRDRFVAALNRLPCFADVRQAVAA